MHVANTRARKDPAQGNLPERHNDPGINHAELRIEPWGACCDLGFGWCAVATRRRPSDRSAFHDVGDIQVLTTHSNLVKQLIEEPPRPPHKRLSAFVLFPPRGFADEHHPGAVGPYAWNGLGPSLAQRAPLTASDCSVKGGQR